MSERFRNVEKIGSGGFGEVWKIVRTTDQATFAKKVLIEESEEAIERFHREVRLFSKLDHPRIVKVIDVHLDNKPYWYVMPLYKYSLHDILNKISGNRSEIYSVYTAILEGMAYAHSQGVIHRDLKPENILLNDISDIAISDFGLGRALDATTSRKTQTGDVFGTFLYMAPEQMNDAKYADFYSDIYSLGRILYVLYTEPLTSTDLDLSRLPVGIAIIVDKCSKRNPFERFKSVRELMNSFHAIFNREWLRDDKDKLRLLTGELIAGARLNKNKIREINDLISGLETDEDEIQDLCMKLPDYVFAELYRNFPSTVHTIVDIFVKIITSQDWPFRYTDEIGRACRQIYFAVDDPVIRAKLLIAIMEVGVTHNRYFVLDIFRSLMHNQIDELVAEALERELIKNQRSLLYIADELELSRLPSRLAELIIMVKSQQT